MYISKKLHRCIISVLIGIILITGTELVFIFANVLKPASGDRIVVATIFVFVLSLLAVGLIGFFVKKKSESPIEEIHSLLKRFIGKDGFARYEGNDNGAIIVPLVEMMHELRGLLQSIQAKLHGIDRSAEALTEGIRQVATDQNNLFSLSAEIEAVRANRDGFSIITGEVLSLVERTGQLTVGVRNMADQLRTEVTGVIAELERLAKRVDPSQIDAPTDAVEYENGIRIKEETNQSTIRAASENVWH